MTLLMQTVRQWWFEADAWRDPEARRASEGSGRPGEWLELEQKNLGR